MPPQPVSRIKPIITYHIGPESFDERPHVAQAIAECINAWSFVESAMAWLFTCLLGANEPKGAELYAALESGKAKRDAILALATSTLPADGVALISAVVRYYRSRQKIRDKIAHWLWGVAPELPDALVLVDPKEFSFSMALAKRFLITWRTSSLN